MAVTLPSVSEIVDAIPQCDPVLAYQVGGPDARGLPRPSAQPKWF